jgi:hypothetical protein
MLAKGEDALVGCGEVVVGEAAHPHWPSRIAPDMT